MGDSRNEEELSKKAFKTSQKDIKLMSYQLQRMIVSQEEKSQILSIREPTNIQNLQVDNYTFLRLNLLQFKKKS